LTVKKHDTPEIMIVVDKLLTGFDCPRNTVLYITRNLKEHTLLQAIVRMNRICEGKEFGYIIDYYGIPGQLDEALTNYSALEEFDEEDLTGTLTVIKDEIEKLPQIHSDKSAQSVYRICGGS
jgi:type I restriction enzyme R subunit